MADDKKEKWLNWLALTTLIFSAAATLGSSKAGGYSGKAMSEQILASDQWAFYQAKSIKSYIYEIQKQQMELRMQADRGLSSGPLADRYKAIMSDYDKQIKRYDVEKAEIKAVADNLAKSKENAQQRAGNFGYALIFLQISIMLSSVSALTKKKPLFFIGLALSLGWAFFFLDAFWLFC